MFVRSPAACGRGPCGGSNGRNPFQPVQEGRCESRPVRGALQIEDQVVVLIASTLHGLHVWMQCHSTMAICSSSWKQPKRHKKDARQKNMAATHDTPIDQCSWQEFDAVVVGGRSEVQEDHNTITYRGSLDEDICKRSAVQSQCMHDQDPVSAKGRCY
jgi:hypothetical protein